MLYFVTFTSFFFLNCVKFFNQLTKVVPCHQYLTPVQKASHSPIFPQLKNLAHSVTDSSHWSCG